MRAGTKAETDGVQVKLLSFFLRGRLAAFYVGLPPLGAGEEWRDGAEIIDRVLWRDP